MAKTVAISQLKDASHRRKTQGTRRGEARLNSRLAAIFGDGGAQHSLIGAVFDAYRCHIDLLFEDFALLIAEVYRRECHSPNLIGWLMEGKIRCHHKV